MFGRNSTKNEVKEILKTNTLEDCNRLMDQYRGVELNHDEFQKLKKHTLELAGKACEDQKYVGRFKSCIAEKMR